MPRSKAWALTQSAPHHKPPSPPRSRGSDYPAQHPPQTAPSPRESPYTVFHTSQQGPIKRPHNHNFDEPNQHQNRKGQFVIALIIFLSLFGGPTPTEQPTNRYNGTNYWQHGHAKKSIWEITLFNSRGYQVDDYPEQNNAKDGDANG